MAAGVKRWRELADRVAAEAGYDLEDFAVVDAGRRQIVRVIIDADDGVDLDAAAAVSRALSAAMDADEDAAPQGAGSDRPYTLEVTSPGIGRPLTAPRHFHRARTRLVAITTTDGDTLVARVIGVTDSGVDLLTGRNGVTPRHLSFEEIASARAEVDFSGPSAAAAALLAADPRSADRMPGHRPADGETDPEPQNGSSQTP